MNTHPRSRADLHPAHHLHPTGAAQGEGEIRPQMVRRQRCQQCQVLVMPAALDGERCSSCTGQLDLFPLPTPAAITRTDARTDNDQEI